MAATDLSVHLLRQRELMELLLFKLEELEMLVTTGRTRWVRHASAEVERVIEAIGAGALARDGVFVEVAREWGVPEAMTLRELVEVAPGEAWREVMQSHLEVMTQLADEIAQKRSAVDRHLRTALRVTQETIAGLGEPTGEYAATGSRLTAPSSRLLDVQV
ncbi:flagellar protein FlgN [Microbacterium sp. NPDC090007]|uniref:flagellar protein FlgN n=1 Tax=Microbacterium sp. NPDC090007 TaxID=3364204 RepID=UPI0038205BC8